MKTYGGVDHCGGQNRFYYFIYIPYITINYIDTNYLNYCLGVIKSFVCFLVIFMHEI
jgi:hypothetical protein